MTLKCGACSKEVSQEYYRPFLFCPYCGKGYPEKETENALQLKKQSEYVSKYIFLILFVSILLMLVWPLLMVFDFIEPTKDTGLAITLMLGFLLVELLMAGQVLKRKASKLFPLR